MCSSDLFAPSHDPHAAAILPANIAKKGGADLGQRFVVAIRLEGIEVSVNDRASNLLAGGFGIGEGERLGATKSRDLWQKIRDVDLQAGCGEAIWKLSVAPSQAPAILEVVMSRFDIDFYADWAGGLVWIAAPSGPAFGAALREALAAHGSGYAQMIIGATTDSDSVSPFQPLSPAHAALHRRVKAAFDPMGVLNYGRMHDGF